MKYFQSLALDATDTWQKRGKNRCVGSKQVAVGSARTGHKECCPRKARDSAEL